MAWGAYLLTASYENTVRLWDLGSGRPLTIPIQISGQLTGAGFHENGSQIVTTSAGRTYRLWDFPRDVPDLELSDLARVVSEKNLNRGEDARDALLERSDHELTRWILSPDLDD